jgi:hypothetical protein
MVKTTPLKEMMKHMAVKADETSPLMKKPFELEDTP